MITQLKAHPLDLYSNHEQVQNAFTICNIAWNEVKDKLKGHRFSKEEQEIEFFKKIKPLFTSKIEYYCLIYHGLLFEPDEHSMAIEFWRRERGRLQKFRTDHKDFIACYQNEVCLMNRHYFLRNAFLETGGPGLKLYDDKNSVTNGDVLVATMIALTRYEDYSKARLSLYDFK
jgi:hypothetical protein